MGEAAEGREEEGEADEDEDGVGGAGSGERERLASIKHRTLVDGL